MLSCLYTSRRPISLHMKFPVIYCVIHRGHGLALIQLRILTCDIEKCFAVDASSMFTLHAVDYIKKKKIILLLYVCNLWRVFSKRSFRQHSAYFHSAFYPSFRRKKFCNEFSANYPLHSAIRKISLPLSIFKTTYPTTHCSSSNQEVLKTSGDAGDAGDAGETCWMLWKRAQACYLWSLLLRQKWNIPNASTVQLLKCGNAISYIETRAISYFSPVTGLFRQYP